MLALRMTPAWPPAQQCDRRWQHGAQPVGDTHGGAFGGDACSQGRSGVAPSGSLSTAARGPHRGISTEEFILREDPGQAMRLPVAAVEALAALATHVRSLRSSARSKPAGFSQLGGTGYRAAVAQSCRRRSFFGHACRGTETPPGTHHPIQRRRRSSEPEINESATHPERSRPRNPPFPLRAAAHSTRLLLPDAVTADTDADGMQAWNGTGEVSYNSSLSRRRWAKLAPWRAIQASSDLLQCQRAPPSRLVIAIAVASKSVPPRCEAIAVASRSRCGSGGSGQSALGD